MNYQSIKKEINLPLLAISLCVISFGASGLYTRFSDGTVLSNLLFRFWLAIPFYMVMVYITCPAERRFKMKMREALFLIFIGGLYAGDTLFYFEAINYTSLSYAQLINLSTPLIIVPLSLLIYRELPPKLFYVGFLLSMVGLYFVLGNVGHSGNQEQFKGFWLAAVATLFFALYLFLLAHHRLDYNVWKIMLFISLGAGLTVLTVAGFTESPLLPPNLKSWLLAIGFAFTSQILSQVLLTYSATRLPVSLTSNIILATPIVGGLLGWFIFREVLTVLQFLGMFVCLFGIYITKRAYDRLERSHGHKIEEDIAANISNN